MSDAGSVFGGLRVLDASTGVAGPLAAMLLADFGADVLKLGGAGRDEPGWAVWNRGKRNAGVGGDDVAELPDGGDDVAELLDGADVCVVSDPIDRLAGSALDPAAAVAGRPRLVYLHTPPYLDTVPWAGGAESNALLAAVTGVSLRQSSFDGGPIESVYPHLLTLQGLWAAAAVTAALIERDRSGLGQVVTVAGVHGMMIAGGAWLTFDPRQGPAPAPTGGPGGVVPFYRTYQCADGEWLFLAALTPRFTTAAFSALGVSDLLEPERGGRAALLRPDVAEAARARIAAEFRTRTRAEWVAALSAAGCPVGEVRDREAWLDHPQIAAIGMRVTVEDPDRGTVVMAGVPVRLDATPGSVRGPAPGAGAVAEGWVADPEPAASHKAAGVAGVAGDGPLGGVRVLDLGAIIAGPFAGSLLAELGADVVKIEPPSGDSFRGPGFAAYNKGQRSVVLDLQSPAGRDALLALAAMADVVIDNYRPGVLARLGIAYDDLVAVNPAIVSFSITGFGEGGPLSGEAGFDPVLQAMSGMMRAQGGDSEPVLSSVPIDDVAAAAATAFGVCAALRARQRTGAGQRGWTSLAGMSAFVQAAELVRFAGRPAPECGSRDHPGPSDGDRYHPVADGWVRAAGWVPDPALTREAAVADAASAGVPAAPARHQVELIDDAELLAWEVLVPDPRPDHEGWWTAGRHARFSRTPRAGTLVAPSLGAHTAEVLAETGLGGPAPVGRARRAATS